MNLCFDVAGVPAEGRVAFDAPHLRASIYFVNGYMAGWAWFSFF
jgi:hypothetical protein